MTALLKLSSSIIHGSLYFVYEFLEDWSRWGSERTFNGGIDQNQLNSVWWGYFGKDMV